MFKNKLTNYTTILKLCQGTNTSRVSKTIIRKNPKTLIITPHKTYFDSKSLKWYWREINYDMFHNEIYKDYLIQRRDKLEYNSKSKSKSPHVEFIPNRADKRKYDSCLIWLYDGDWLEMFIDHFLEFNNFPPRNYKIVFYRAPVNPITFDSSVLERNWFNILDLPNASGFRDINKKDIYMFNKEIHREIQDQYNLIGNYDNIFIGGFSQSASMALYSTLTFKDNLGGCIALSGFNFDFTPLDFEKKNVKFLMINGTRDEVVLIKHARNSYENMIKLGFNIKFIEEPGLFHFFSKTGLSHADNLLRNKSLL
jgi:predicted esterase